MIRDKHLIFAENLRPAMVTAAAAPLPAFFPDGGATPATTWYSFADLMDLGQGRNLIARMDVKTTFTGDVANTAALFVAISKATTAAGILTDHVMLARSVAVPRLSLLAGSFVEVVVPKLSSYAAAYAQLAASRADLKLALGLEIYATATDFTAGAVDAYLLLDSSPNTGVLDRIPPRYGTNYPLN